MFLPIVLAVGVTLQAIANRFGGTGVALKAANVWLLVASLVFYAWGEATLVWVMVASCLLNYIGGLWCTPGRRGRNGALATVVIGNLGLLAVFKYSGMASGTLNAILADFHHSPVALWPTLALPLGISFYTFHGISYVVDVWSGKVAPCRSLRDFMCYSTLFPQLVAGPIVRYAEVGHFLSQRTVSLDDLGIGARRFIVGLGKKVLIANQVSIVADAVFALPSPERSTAAAWFGLAAYALQIYFDFSGYSDMALGLGRMFGFRFPENFEFPYAADSMREFWRRWHMTLSRFFRDYVYIPLGGNRKGVLRTAVNLFIVFALCGLWHGASWTFVAWGLYHGFFLAAERVLERPKTESLGGLRIAGHGYTLIVVLLGWVLFRAGSWSEAIDYYRTLFGHGMAGSPTWVIPADLLTPAAIAAFGTGLVLCVPTASVVRQHALDLPLLKAAWPHAQLAFEAAVLVLCVLSIGAGSHDPFIYFRF